MRRRQQAAIGIAVTVSLLVLAVLGGFGGVVYVLPALLLLVTLAARRYPGERALLGLVHRRRAYRPNSDSAAASYASAPRALLPRGGRLIASSLAVRPPPLARALSSC